MVKRIVPFILILAIILVGFKIYRSSVQEDFNDISHVEINRIGESYTGIYHRPACPKVETIKSQKVEFENNNAAKSAGYSPCKRCKPDQE